MLFNTNNQSQHVFPFLGNTRNPSSPLNEVPGRHGPASISKLPVAPSPDPDARKTGHPEETATCAHCGTEFTYIRKRKPRKYCSERCKVTALQARRGKHNERRRQADIRQRTPEKALLAAAKSNAKRKGIGCQITHDWIRERLAVGYCEVTGLPFVITPYAPKRKGNRGFFAPSLDRIDNAGHYTPSNTRLVIWGYNLAKSQFTDRDVTAMALGTLVGVIPKATWSSFLDMLPPSIIAALPSGTKFRIKTASHTE